MVDLEITVVELANDLFLARALATTVVNEEDQTQVPYINM
jgi:hypothetical protein